MMKCLYGFMAGCWLVGGVFAQTDLRPIVEQALDQPTELTVESAPLDEVFAVIANETGVDVTVAPGAIDLLPYGSATEVTAEIRNITLREGLTRLLAPLGMTFEATQTGIEVFPGIGLERLGRRATWPELKTLEWLRNVRFDQNPDAVSQLRGRMQFQVPDPNPWPLLSAAIEKVGAGPGDDVLEIACRSLGWTWYPWGEQVAVVSLRQQMERQLSLLVSVRLSHRPLSEVLRDLARQAGLAIRLGPDAADALPIQTRKSFTLIADNVTAAEALEEIALATGLNYEVRDDGVVLTAPGSPATAATEASESTEPSRRRDPYVAKITLPVAAGGYQLEFVVRESDLSPEVNELRKKLLDDANRVMEEALRQRFESESPTTE